jgi:hypothetical protein
MIMDRIAALLPLSQRGVYGGRPPSDALGISADPA